jgi:2-iminoacetate synthase
MTPLIAHEAIERRLETRTDALRFAELLAKARELRGLAWHEAVELLSVEDPDLVHALFENARWIKHEIYGRRVVLFAPLYVSNLCRNDCAYCGFRRSNHDVVRRILTREEIRTEVEVLLAQGHKRLLLVSGESYPREGLAFVFRALDTIYEVATGHGSIRRVNVNIAPLTVDEFRELKRHRIGTYQIFQETYHEPTYRDVHRHGMKADYEYRLKTPGRAMEGGIEDVGIGVLFGLYDWRYEVAALLQHVGALEHRYGVGPHTISVPRIEPAAGSPLSENPPAPLSDAQFLRVIAVLRLAVPWTGIIVSTRETASIRRAALELGVSQMSAGSETSPGGYSHENATQQFTLGDHRPLAGVVDDLVEAGHLPSFCTGCYRKGRVGKDFMDLAKPGLIRQHCLPNGLFTFAEYLHDFGDDASRERGFALIDRLAADESIGPAGRMRIATRLDRIAHGERDVFV